MKAHLVTTGMILALLFAVSSCDKGCTCKYYDENGVLIETENWDSEMLSEAECSNMDGQTNVSITVDSQDMVAGHVSCTSGVSIF